MTNDGDLITQIASMPARISLPPENHKLYSTGSSITNYENWFVSAYIEASSDLSMGEVDLLTWTELTSSVIEIFGETAKGSLPVEIPCSTTNPSTGSTCSAGSESVGVVFTPPYVPTTVEVCGNFGIFIYREAKGGSTNDYFRWVETPNNAQTVSQDGGVRIGATLAGNTTNHFVLHPLKICGTFTFTTFGKKTLRLFHQVDVNTATGNGNDVRIRTPFLRRAYINVRPLR
jgi:hypothetical protein